MSKTSRTPYKKRIMKKRRASDAERKKEKKKRKDVCVCVCMCVCMYVCAYVCVTTRNHAVYEGNVEV